MKKIDRCIGLDGDERSWKDIETLYYNAISKQGKSRYKTPLQKIQELKRRYRFGKKRSILLTIENDFERIVKATPELLKTYIKDFEERGLSSQLFNATTKKQTSFGKKIEDAMRYSYFRTTVLVDHAERINVKACPYCNSQFTLVVVNNADKIAKFQFDHYFSKSQFPYLSISLYNLVPSCANCNLSKSSNFYELYDFVNPYAKDFYTLTSFKINSKEAVRLHADEDVPEKDIIIEITNLTDASVKNYEKEFHLTGIYNRHKDIVKEIYRKAYAYNHGGKEALLKLKKPNGEQLFKDINEIEQLLLANYRLKEDINKRPLSKFMQDIAKDAGLI